jgi:putative endonuclease
VIAADETALVANDVQATRERGPRTNAQRLGDAAEDHVAGRLAEAGWTIVARNIHVRRAEIDLIAVDPGPPAALVFVEVRWRGRRDYGLADESVDFRKRARLHRAAWEWLAEPPDGRLTRLPVRFDLVVVEPDDGGTRPRLRHHRAAI